RYKDKVGMKIADWMISEAMKYTEHYQMYAEVFGIDVPLTQSQPTESTQGTGVIDDSSISKNDKHNIPGTRLEPMSDKESLEVEFTNVVILVNVNEEEEEIIDETKSYASDDDEIPTKQVSQDNMEEVSLTIDEAKLKKIANEMLRQRCTSGDEPQYHIDQMENFLKSNIVWESRKEILVSPHP
nr:hypothetical protein [Tanacetum cinerariifolium]